MQNYFAYGSNLDRHKMYDRCRSARILGVARLAGYRLGFTRYSTGWEGGVADVLVSPQDEVWGLVYQIDNNDLLKLDKFEGYPKAYTRFQTSVHLSTGLLEDVWVYTVVDKQAHIAPTGKYLNIIRMAADELVFPKSYCGQLETISTKD